MLHQYCGETKRLSLIPLLQQHIEPLRQLRNRERQYFVFSKELSVQEQCEWYNQYQRKPNDYMFCVTLKARANEFIGATALYDVDKLNKTAEFGRIVIDKSKCEDNGIGAEATLATCKIGFDLLDLKKIELEVFKDNLRAIRAYEKVGFQTCGEQDNLLLMEITKEQCMQDNI